MAEAETSGKGKDMSATETIARLRELRANATAGEWETSLTADSYEQRAIYGPNHEQIAKVINGSAMPGRTTANAAAIVAAMNSLESLLECAEALEQFRSHYPHGVNRDLDEAASKARAALHALAEGGGE
jgi:hypothetical protein